MDSLRTVVPTKQAMKILALLLLSYLVFMAGAMALEGGRSFLGTSAYYTFYLLTSISLANPVAAGCISKNGGIFDKYPERLSLRGLLHHNSCLGRFHGDINQEQFVYAIEMWLYAILATGVVIFYNRQRLRSLAAKLRSNGLNDQERAKVARAAFNEGAESVRATVQSTIDRLEAQTVRLNGEIKFCIANHSNTSAIKINSLESHVRVLEAAVEKWSREYNQLQRGYQLVIDEYELLKRTDAAVELKKNSKLESIIFEMQGQGLAKNLASAKAQIAALRTEREERKMGQEKLTRQHHLEIISAAREAEELRRQRDAANVAVAKQQQNSSVLAEAASAAEAANGAKIRELEGALILLRGAETRAAQLVQWQEQATAEYNTIAAAVLSKDTELNRRQVELEELRTELQASKLAEQRSAAAATAALLRAQTSESELARIDNLVGDISAPSFTGSTSVAPTAPDVMEDSLPDDPELTEIELAWLNGDDSPVPPAAPAVVDEMMVERGDGGEEQAQVDAEISKFKSMDFNDSYY